MLAERPRAATHRDELRIDKRPDITLDRALRTLWRQVANLAERNIFAGAQQREDSSLRRIEVGKKPGSSQDIQRLAVDGHAETYASILE